MDLRNLVVVLGDQLDPASSVFEGFDRERDRVWMAEVAEEATHVPAHKARIALYWSAMRHFRQSLEAAGLTVIYRAIGEHDLLDLEEALAHDLHALRPRQVVVCEPGEWRVQAQLDGAAGQVGVPLEVRTDRHFLCSTERFETWAQGRTELRLASFYRYMRRHTGVLMDGDRPAGGRWFLERELHQRVAEGDPVTGFAPDALTWGVLARVKRHFPDHPGTLDGFDWPVTPTQAETALEQFVRRELHGAGADSVCRARLAAALNLKLLRPARVLEAALAAQRDAGASLPAVERLVRQVLGWREFLHGLYRYFTPDYRHANALGANRPLPAFYWSGETDMACLADVIGNALAHGHAPPAARFTVTGLFALLLGVHPLRLQQWNLGMGADAVEWMELPVTFGPSQFADAGRWSPQPFVADGRHIQRTTGYCQGCRYRPAEALGEDACPFTTLYWDFLARHRSRFAAGRSTRHGQELAALDPGRLAAIRRRAAVLKARFAPIQEGFVPA